VTKTTNSLSRIYLHITEWRDGKMKNGWKKFYSKNNLIHDSEGKEENGYPVPDSN
jgi:hypothetical protein